MVMEILFLVMLNALFYYRMFKYEYVIDDLTTVVFQDKIPPKGKWIYFWTHLKGKSYYNRNLTHALVLIIHIIVCVLIWYAFGQNKVSLIAATLFAVNPINNQVSVWMSGKPYGLAAICVLLMFVIPGIAPVLQWVALTFAMNALCGSVMFLFTEWPFLALLCPLMIVWKLKFIKKKGMEIGTLSLPAIRWNKIIIFTKTYGYYFRQVIWPTRLGFYQTFIYTYGIDEKRNRECFRLDKSFFWGLFCGALVLAIAIFAYDGMFGLAWGLLWFSVNIAMWCNFITIQQNIAFRYLYLANIGMSLALANIVIMFPELFFIFFTFYATRLWIFMPMYQDDFRLTEYCIWETPKFYYAWLMRGNKFFARKQYMEAIMNYNEANKYEKDNMKVMFNIAVAHIAIGSTNAARELLDKVSKLKHGDQDELIAGFIDRARKLIEDIEISRLRGEKSLAIPDKRFEIVV